MSYRTALDEDRRLVILRLLAKAPAYTVGEHIIYTALPSFGHEISLDRVRADLTWLEEQGLITVERPGASLLGRLTQRGVDVANDRAYVPGVRRPGPEE